MLNKQHQLDFLIEAQFIRTSDSKTLFLTGGEFELIGFSGYGMVGFEYDVRRGFDSDVYFVDKVLPSNRNVEVVLRAKSKNMRSEYWNLRRTIIDFFRPNRAPNIAEAPSTLYVEIPTGERFSLDYRYSSGLEFGAIEQGGDNSYGFDVNVSLVCFDPFWRKATATSLSLDSSEAEELVFPITFPIKFGSEGLQFTTSLAAYGGTWKTFPEITITGPYTTATLNLSNNLSSISLLVAIGAGETRTLKRTDTGLYTVVDANGDDMTNEMEKTSDLASFFILPQSELLVGTTQTLTIALLDGVDGTSGVTGTYFERYVGI